MITINGHETKRTPISNGKESKSYIYSDDIAPPQTTNSFDQDSQLEGALQTQDVFDGRVHDLYTRRKQTNNLKEGFIDHNNEKPNKFASV